MKCIQLTFRRYIATSSELYNDEIQGVSYIYMIILQTVKNSNVKRNEHFTFEFLTVC